jgi:hypothetical protein
MHGDNGGLLAFRLSTTRIQAFRLTAIQKATFLLGCQQWYKVALVGGPNWAGERTPHATHLWGGPSLCDLAPQPPAAPPRLRGTYDVPGLPATSFRACVQVPGMSGAHGLLGCRPGFCFVLQCRGAAVLRCWVLRARLFIEGQCVVHIR